MHLWPWDPYSEHYDSGYLEDGGASVFEKLDPTFSSVFANEQSFDLNAQVKESKDDDWILSALLNPIATAERRRRPCLDPRTCFWKTRDSSPNQSYVPTRNNTMHCNLDLFFSFYNTKLIRSFAPNQ
jgi:hypothetical protein